VPNNPKVGLQITPTNSAASQAAPMMPKYPNNSMYWQALVTEFMQYIPLVPLVYPPKEDKLMDRVASRNPNTYGGSYDPVELEEWIRGMEKIFTVIEVPQ